MTARSSRAGFTFPELLNMLVIGAILALIIYGLRHGRRGPAPDPAIAPMRSALMDLRDAEARFHGQTRQFTTRLDSLNVAASAGITREIDRADSVSWHATARKEGSSLLCELTVGTPGVADTVVCRLGAP
jgi:Tfp pilus assembly protein PilE